MRGTDFRGLTKYRIYLRHPAQLHASLLPQRKLPNKLCQSVNLGIAHDFLDCVHFCVRMTQATTTTGTALAMHLVDDALAVLDEMATFGEAGVSQSEPLCSD